jgi:hypothetical protein
VTGMSIGDATEFFQKMPVKWKLRLMPEIKRKTKMNLKP